MFLFVIFALMSICTEGLQSFLIKPDERTTVVGKIFSHKIPAETISQKGYTFKPYAADSDSLPSWLYFNNKKNILQGVPSHHDKGRHDIKLDVVSDETNKTIVVLSLLYINVVPYEEDLNHLDVLKFNGVQRNQSQSSLYCPGHTPILVATLVFDLNHRKLSGEKRVELLEKVSEWLGIGTDMIRLLPGKGDKSAFNLKDVVLLTGGPGSVDDPQERGVSISWQVGCGDSVAGVRPVSMLKLASETDEFKKTFHFPVSMWHVLHGMSRRPQVVRVRRQAPAGVTPIPTSSFVPRTMSVVTRTSGIAGTPVMSPSPTFIMAPTTTRISPSPTQPPRSPVVTWVPPPINTPPVLINPIGTLEVDLNVNFAYPVPRNTFVDKEDGDTPFLNLNVYDMDGNPFPNDFWCKFDPNTQAFSGTPTEIGKFRILLIATDSGKLNAWDNITIIVLPPNTPPELINHIDLIKLFIGQPIKFPVPYDTFYDKEQGDTRHLTLSMTTIEGEELPSWVNFDSLAQTIYALPMEGQVGKPEFLMIASDNRSKTARDAFEFHVFLLPLVPNNLFGLVLDAPFVKFGENVETRVKVCIRIGEYFSLYFNTTYKDIRVRDYRAGSVLLEWSFANLTSIDEAVMYKEKYMIGDDGKPVEEFDDHIKNDCPIQNTCPVEKVYVEIEDPNQSTPSDPNIIARVAEKGGGTWWKYTIIPAIVVAAIVFIIGLIIIICIRCRRKNNMEKNDKVVFLYRKKPAVFREEYPMKEMYGDQPLITPSEKPPLPPPSYPRSSTPTEDPNAALLSDSSPSYQPPSFDNGPEQGANARSPAPSYRLPPPYVAP